MRVLFIASNIPTPSQSNNAIILTIAQQMSKYCKIDIVYPRPYVPFFLRVIKKYGKTYRGPEWKYDGRSIYPYTYPRLPIAGIAFRFFDYFFSWKKIKFPNSTLPDLVHAHYIFADGSLALSIKKEYKIPYIVSVRGDDARRIGRLDGNSYDYKHAREILMNASKILCLNHFQKNAIESRFSVIVEVLPHGIEKSDIIDPSLKSDNDIIRVSVVGELIKQKKIDWVINAVKDYDGSNNLFLDVLGDGPLRTHFEKESKGYSNITIRGKVPRSEVMDALTESDIFCLPSERETFGLVYIEAAAKGNAIVARYNDGIWKVFEEGNQVLYAKDEKSFKNYFYQLVDNSNMRNSLIEQSNKKVREITWVQIAKKYYNNYLNVIKGNS